MNSNTTIQEADEQLYEFVRKYVPEGTDVPWQIDYNENVLFINIILWITGKGCVAGNSVYMDKWFVIKYLPKLNAHLHYRLIDVSTLKELFSFV